MLRLRERGKGGEVGERERERERERKRERERDGVRCDEVTMQGDEANYVDKRRRWIHGV